MGRSKAFLPFRGGTFISEIAEAVGTVCSPVIAVFGFDAENSTSQAPAGVVPLENPQYRLGMLTSLQAGLRAVPATCDVVMFTLVDHPAVTSATIATLLRAATASGSLIAIPRYAGKLGHPVLISRSLFAEFLALPPEAKVRDVIDRHADRINYVEVEDPGISDDIDDPQLYERLLAREARPA